MKTLIVDDEFGSWLVLKNYLEPYGNCDRAANGQDALEAFHLALTIGEPYDLVCMDIMMPLMDGQDALRRIRAMEEEWEVSKGNEAIIIMTTALFNQNEIEQAHNKGRCTDYLVKPITRKKVEGKLREHRLIK